MNEEKIRRNFCSVVYVTYVCLCCIYEVFKQNGSPAESSLGPFQDEELEECAIVVNGDAPFAVVVLGIEGVIVGNP